MNDALPARLDPGSTIGILGDGQLGRMIALAAARLGYRCHTFADQPDSPAAQVCAASTLADYRDRKALDAFAAAVDVVTLEFENVPEESVRYLAERVPVRPGPDVLATAQDRLLEKGFLNGIGIRTAPYAPVTNLPAKAIADAALQRERMMPTGLGLCVAVPHARVHGLGKPMVCLGISREGLEFNAPDGERSRMIFRILTPAEDDGAQLEILADISRTFLNAPMREAAMRANTYSEFIAMLKTREPGDHFHGQSPQQSSRE
jgi:mannitol/fructose-specific phosphotransferase system IIA component (Ntr-type)